MQTDRGSRKALWLALPAAAVVVFLFTRGRVEELPSPAAIGVAVAAAPEARPESAGTTSSGRSEVSPAEAPRESPPTSAGAALPQLRLSVIDETSAPVAGASVHFVKLSDELSGVSLGETDPRGQLEMPLPAEAGFLLVDHDSYPRAERLVSAGQTAEVRLVLSGLASLRGRVVDARGGRVTVEPWVLAFPDRNPPTKRRVEALVRGASSLPSTSLLGRVDPTGYFELSGVDPRETYTVVVGGNGVACSTPLRRVQPSAEEVSVVAGPLFGALLRFVTEGQSDLTADPRLWRAMNPRWTWAPELGEGLATGTLGAIVAGISLEHTGSTVLGAGTPVVLIGPAEVERLGPIRVEGQLIGHDPVDVAVTLPRFRGGTLEVVPIPLRARSARMVRLDIELRGIETARSSKSTLHQDVGVITLQPEDEGAPYILKLDSWTNQVIVLEAIPAGVYAAGIQTHQGFLAHPPVGGPTVDIPASGGRLVFDLRASCELEILVGRRGDSGQLHTGEICLGLSRTLEDGSTHSSVLVFDRAPYVLTGVLEQLYELTLYRPFYTAHPALVDMKSVLGSDRRATVTIVD